MELEELHVTILTLTALVILYADHEGFSYIRGKKPVLDEKKTHWLHRAVWAGLLGMIATGFIMFWPGREYYLSEPEFLVKMCMVFALLANGVLIGHLSKVSYTTPFAELPAKTKRLLFLSGAISTGGWIGAATIGFFFL